MKNLRHFIGISLIVGFIFFLAIIFSQQADAYQYNPSSGGSVTSGTVISVGDPLTVGGATSSTVSGSGTSTFGKAATFGGIATSTIVGDDTASLIPNIDTYRFFSRPAAFTAGVVTCGGVQNISDPGVCLQDIYNADNAVQSTTALMFPYGTFNTATPVTFNTFAHLVFLNGQPGAGTVWNYTGTTSTVAMTFDDCNSNNKRPAVQMQHFTLIGANAAAGGPTAIYAGGPNGGCMTKLDDIHIQGFLVGLHTGSNTYMFAFTNSLVQSNGQGLWIGQPSNSGEHMLFDNDTWGNPVASASATQYVFIDVNGVSSAEFHTNSFDCVGAQISSGALSVSFTGDNHFENPCRGTPFYTYLDVLSSTGSTVNVWGATFMNDATSTAETPGNGQFYANCGAVCNFYGVHWNRNGSATTTVVGISNTNSLANARITSCGSDLATVPFTTATVKGGGIVLLQNNGCLYGMGGSFMQGYNFNPGNNQMTWYGGGSGPSFITGGNLGGVGTAVSNCFAGNAVTCVGSSTLFVNGSFGARTVVFSATTTASGLYDGAQGALTWVFNGGASTTLTLPLLSSSTGDVKFIINRGSAPFTLVASSTDFITIGDATTTSYTVTRGQSLALQNDATRWSVISHDPQRYVTASIGGASLAAGACTSTTNTVDNWITTSTSNSRVYTASPTTFPGAGAAWQSYLSSQGVVTTEVCEIVLGTPTASTYTFTIN